MTYNGHSYHHPVPVDYSVAAVPDTAAGTGGWSLVDLKPCVTSSGLSTYTGS